MEINSEVRVGDYFQSMHLPMSCHRWELDDISIKKLGMRHCKKVIEAICQILDEKEYLYIHLDDAYCNYKSDECIWVFYDDYEYTLIKKKQIERHIKLNQLIN